MTEQFNIPPKIDLNIAPRWAVEKYHGMEKDIEEWLISYYFWKEWEGKDDLLDTTSAKARAIAMARYKTLAQTDAIKIASDQSALLQWYEAAQTGWFKHIKEIDDVKELMAHILEEAQEKDPGSSTASDYLFVLNTLIPLCEKYKIPKEMIICIPKNLTKARYSVPTMRQIISNNGNQMGEHLAEIVKGIVDSNLTARTFREEYCPAVMGKETPKTLPSVKANVCLMPDGGELIIIRSDSAHTKAIQISTRSIISGFDYTDAAYLLKEIGNIVMPKKQNRRRYKANEFGRLVESSDGGVYLPALESFKDLVISEYLKHRFYIRKPGKQILLIEELALTYNLNTFAESLGYVNKQDAFDAMMNLYKPVLDDLPNKLPAEDFVVTELKVDYLTGATKPAYYMFLELVFGEK